METILKTKINVKILINVIYVVVALILPQIFHLILGNGNAYLPMHIPVLLAGFSLGPVYGLLAGVSSPVISHMLTGMPAVFPAMPMMIAELGAYGLTAGLLLQYAKKMPFMAKLLITMATGRIASGITAAIIGLPAFATVWTAIKTGLPGIAIQIGIAAIVVLILKKQETLA